MSIMKISGIKKSFGGNKVLDGIDMELDAGKIYQLIGPNGCGKTTLINIITGLLKADEGEITFDGNNITQKGLLSTYKSGLIRTWQTPQPFKTLTTMENFVTAGPKNIGESFLYAPMRPKWRKDEERLTETAIAVSSKLNLHKKGETYSGNLSGGQQKLVELGKTMMAGAKMVLLDEPIAGVNPKLAVDIFDRIGDSCRRDGVTFLFIEHRLDIALKYTDKVFALNQGKIIAQGTSDEVINHPEVVESYLGV